jgi:hypothetical protein
MTELEVYDLVTLGGGSDFAKVIRVCESVGPNCLIGGLAGNCYVEPVYTIDAALAMVLNYMPRVSERLAENGFILQTFEHSVLTCPAAICAIQFTTDPRYQDFPSRSERRTVLGIDVMVACLEDVTKDKLWAYADPARRLSKRKKDELDLVRLAEEYPGLKRTYPRELANMLGGSE